MAGLEGCQVFRRFGDRDGLNNRRFDCNGRRLFVTSGLLSASRDKRRKAHYHEERAQPEFRRECERWRYRWLQIRAHVRDVSSKSGCSYCTGCARLLQAWGFLEHYTDRRASVRTYLTLNFTGGKRPLARTYVCWRLRRRPATATQAKNIIAEKPEITSPAVRSQVR